MRVAVLVSGSFSNNAPNSDLKRNLDNIKLSFPNADFYYATWDRCKEDFEKTFPNENCLFVPEPVMEYHPYIDIKTKDYIGSEFASFVTGRKKDGSKEIERTLHHSKQIIIHAELFKTIPDDYDVVIRTRFDVVISPKAKFDMFITDTYTNNRVNAFAFRPIRIGKDFHNLLHVQKGEPKIYLYDIVIIHPYKLFDPDETLRLHDEHKLHAAEFGWAQVLTMKTGFNHNIFHGWTAPEWMIHKFNIPKLE